MADTARQLADAQERAQVQLQADEAKVSVANTMSDATVFWTERMQNAMTQAPKDAAGFTQNTLTDFDAWTQQKLDAQTSEPAKRLLEDNLRRMRLHMHAEAFNFEVQQRNKALEDDFYTGLDADRRAVAADPSLFADAQARRVAAAQALSLPPAKRDKLASDARGDLAFDAANALVDRNPAAFLERAGLRTAKGAKGKAGGQAEDAAARVAADPILSSLDPDKLRRVTDRASMIVSQQEAAAAADAERRARQAEIAAERKARAADQAWNIIAGRAASGVATNPGGDPELIAAIAGTPYAAEFPKLMAQVAGRTAVVMRPMAQQQSEIDALIQRRNSGGTDSNLEAEIETRKKLLATQKAAYEASPLRASQQYGLQNVTPIDTSSLDAFVGTIAPRVQQATIAGRQAGSAASPLLPEEAASVSRMLGALKPGEFGDAVAQIAARVPSEQMAALAAQLDPHDKPLALALGAGSDRTTQGRTVAEIIRRGAQFMKDKSIKIDQGAEFGIKAQIAKAVGDSVPQAMRQNVIDAATLIYAGKQGEGDTPAIEDAVRLAVGGNIIERKAGDQVQRVPVPAGVDLTARLAAYPVSSIATQAADGFVYLPGPTGTAVMPAKDFAAALPGAMLEPIGRGRYAVRIGGSLVLNKERRPVVVTAQ